MIYSDSIETKGTVLRPIESFYDPSIVFLDPRLNFPEGDWFITYQPVVFLISGVT